MISNLEAYFKNYRNQIYGFDTYFESPFGQKKIIYADWIASGRAYSPMEEHITNNILPYLANTHTETSVTGTIMTETYNESKKIIKAHVNASDQDVLIFTGSGMTGAIAKLQRILGLKIPERFERYLDTPDPKAYRKLEKRKKVINNKNHFKENHKPIVFITHMEHHSNHTSWLETICDLEIIPCTNIGKVCLDSFEKLLEKYKERKYKIASVTSCSNLTGIEVPVHEIAKIIHKYDGLCFVDYAASAPYIDIDMHPADEEAQLDAIFFSPHKFLGGPGSSGVLIFNSAMYDNRSPDVPGGGTVSFTSPWYMHDYIIDIETREDGGTPPFLQGIRAALAVKIKESMGVKNIIDRKNELLEIFFDEMDKIPQISIAAGHIRKRHGAISLNIQGMHYNLLTRILNDRYGIQVRGGCVCAGTYGHMLLEIEQSASNRLRKEIHNGNQMSKPGFVRISIHPTMTNEEVYFIADALKEISNNVDYWISQYIYDKKRNEFDHKDQTEKVFENKMKETIWNVDFSKTKKKDENISEMS